MAGKERESQLSSQFRDIATIVMQKTFNPETQRPYTISMIERLMHEIHFAVDPHGSSKKQVNLFAAFGSVNFDKGIDGIKFGGIFKPAHVSFKMVQKDFSFFSLPSPH